MELELREAKYRAQTESLKIQLMRDAETKVKINFHLSSLSFFFQLTQLLEEQHTKHIHIEEELNELHRRKLSDLEEKHQQILVNERHEHENRVEILLNKLDQMKNEIEQIQTTTIAERQDLAKKLQDVFETALFKGSTTKTNFSQNEIINSPRPSALQINQIKSQLTDTQIKGINNEYPTNMSTIRSLSSRIDSLVDQTNRVANGFEVIPRLPISSQQENPSEWIDNNQKSVSHFFLFSSKIISLFFLVIYYLYKHIVHFNHHFIVQHQSIHYKNGIHNQFLN
jgi:hypothetical protein